MHGTGVMNAKKILPMRIHRQEEGDACGVQTSVHQSGSSGPQAAKYGRSHCDNDFQDSLPCVFVHFAHSVLCFCLAGAVCARPGFNIVFFGFVFFNSLDSSLALRAEGLVPVGPAARVRHVNPPASVALSVLQDKLVEVGVQADEVEHLSAHLRVRHVYVGRFALQVL